MNKQITADQLEAYHENGFIIIEDLLHEGDVKSLRSRLREYTHGSRSTNRLAIQVEPRVQRGEVVVEHPGDGIRKVGKLVEEDDLFRELGLHRNIRSVLTELLGPDIKMFRNDVMLKPPEVGSLKGMHQDSPYWPITPMELCSCWVPLDDATTKKGCMCAISGGHKHGALPHLRVTDDSVVDESCFDTDGMVVLPMKAGSGMFFHSLLPHYTAPNLSSDWRRAVVMSYMSAKSRYTWEGAGPTCLPVQGRTQPGYVR